MTNLSISNKAGFLGINLAGLRKSHTYEVMITPPRPELWSGVKPKKISQSSPLDLVSPK
jgi:hypothetical protein